MFDLEIPEKLHNLFNEYSDDGLLRQLYNRITDAKRRYRILNTKVRAQAKQDFEDATTEFYLRVDTLKQQGMTNEQYEIDKMRDRLDDERKLIERQMASLNMKFQVVTIALGIFGLLVAAFSGWATYRAAKVSEMQLSFMISGCKSELIKSQ